MVTLSKEQNKKNLKLSIQISLNGLSFCGLSQKENKIVFFKDTEFRKQRNPIQLLEEIKQIYQQESFLRNEDPEVQLLFSNDLYSLVPGPVFSKANASDYLKYNAKILETDYVAQDEMPEQDLVNVYIPYTNINNFFFERHGEFVYRHCVSLLVSSFLKDNENAFKSRVYLYNKQDGYDLVVIRDGKLLLANSFRCSTPEDFIYYLLFTAEQLELDPQQFELILLGKIDKESEFYKIAYTYIKEIDFLKTSFGYIFDVTGDAPKAYKYYTLLKALE